MIRFLKGLVLLPLAVLVVLFAVANRETVSLSFDPFSPKPLFHADVPLYAIIFAAVAVGIVIGGIATWLGQGVNRRRGRRDRIERDRLERELNQHRAAAPVSAQTPYGTGVALPAPR